MIPCAMKLCVRRVRRVDFMMLISVSYRYGLRMPIEINSLLVRNFLFYYYIKDALFTLVEMTILSFLFY